MSEDGVTGRHDATDGPGAASGRRWLRVLLWAIVVAVVIVALFTWVFPWVESLTQDPTLGVSAASPGQVLRSPT